MRPATFCVGRVFGVKLCIDWGLAILLALVTLNMGAGLLPHWHPDWSMTACLGLALVAAFAFVLSVLMHELAHAVVGRLHGIRVSAITLFAFGGIADLEGEAPSARVDFLVAIAGPLMSLLVGTICSALAFPAVARATAHANGVEAVAALGPVATILLWLGPSNLLLGVFNLVPAFPLDGGRILRAILWALLGSVQRATCIAARVGQGIGFALLVLGGAMVLGVHLPYLGGGFVQGAWLGIIGWFLHRAAAMSYARAKTRSLLEDLPVAHVMRSEITAVGADVTLATLARYYFESEPQRAFPVVEGEQCIGLVSRRDLEKVSPTVWHMTCVDAVMTPVANEDVVTPDENSAIALYKLAEHGLEEMPVLKNGQVQGLVRRRDVLRWLEQRLSQTA